MAVIQGHCEVVRELLAAGADIDAIPRNTKGEQRVDSLISLATIEGHVAVTHLLKARMINGKFNGSKEE